MPRSLSARTSLGRRIWSARAKVETANAGSSLLRTAPHRTKDVTADAEDVHADREQQPEQERVCRHSAMRHIQRAGMSDALRAISAVISAVSR